MILAHTLAEISHDPNTVVTVGTFDGVHLAHQEIIREVVTRARMIEGRSVVVTFSPHPKEVVGKEKGNVRLLVTPDEQEEIIRALHVDVLFIINFTEQFSRLTAREFYESYIVRGLGVHEVVVGYDHMFGHNRAGGIEELVRMGKAFNFSVSAVQPFRMDGEIVSSTRVRDFIATGDVDAANRLLGRAFGFSGTIVHGDGRGKTLGYPTANIAPEEERKIIPGHGVYLVGVSLKGRSLYGMMNIGVRPTIEAHGARSIEVHIFDLHDDVYDERVTVSVLRKLRDERRFGSLAELMEQLKKDREISLQYITELEKRS
jgi:riboflavin kinase / FMN adenylyltransferase